MFAAFFGKRGLWFATPLSGPFMILPFARWLCWEERLVPHRLVQLQPYQAECGSWWICGSACVARVVFTMLVSRFGGFNALKCPKQFFKQKKRFPFCQENF